MIRLKGSNLILGPLGWRHCKNAIPGLLIQEIRQELSALMTNLGSPNKYTFFSNIDQQAKTFINKTPNLQNLLQKNLHKLPSVYKLALSREIKDILTINTGWDEVALSPIHNIRVKYPSKYGISPFTTVPWHQDHGATDPGQHNLQIVTAWIPLTSSDEYNGGIEIIPRSTQLGWLEHWRGSQGPEVKPDILAKALKEFCDLKPIKVRASTGDIILFDQYTLHRSLINSSNKMRWSIDMRYTSKGSESGRPGIWPTDPIAGHFIESDVMHLVKQRQDSMDNANKAIIRKRVDQQTSTIN